MVFWRDSAFRRACLAGLLLLLSLGPMALAQTYLLRRPVAGIGVSAPPPTPTPTSCKNVLEQDPGATDGIYQIDPDGDDGETYGLMDVWCDMTTEGVGWTRVTTMLSEYRQAHGGCLFGTAAAGDPKDGGNCTKYSDALINQIAVDKIFFVKVTGYAPTFTKYSDQIRTVGYDTVGSPPYGFPGQLVSRDTYADALAAPFVGTPSYTYFKFFSQHDHGGGSPCFGANPSNGRASCEYVDKALFEAGVWRQGCYIVAAACNLGQAPQAVGTVTEVYLR